MNHHSKTFDIKNAYIEMSRMLALSLAVIAEETAEGFIKMPHYNGGTLLSEDAATQIKFEMEHYVCPQEINADVHYENLALFKRALEAFEFCPPNLIHFKEVFTQTHPDSEEE